jgi:hypothetical protein
MNSKFKLTILILISCICFLGCEHSSHPGDTLPSEAFEDEFCSQMNPTGKCLNEENVCIDGECVFTDIEDESNDEDVEDVNVMEEDTPDDDYIENDVESDDVPLVVNEMARVKFINAEFLKSPYINIEHLKHFESYVELPQADSEEENLSLDDADSEAEDEPSCSIYDLVEINVQGPHAQCMSDNEFAFNYTDSPSENYGICQLMYDGELISAKQYIYKKDGGKLTRHEVLFECVLMMSCYEGILGTDLPLFVDAIKNHDLSSKNVDISVQLYIGGKLYEESNMGNITNAVNILGDMQLPMDNEVYSHTKQHIDDYIDYIEDKC